VSNRYAMWAVRLLLAILLVSVGAAKLVVGPQLGSTWPSWLTYLASFLELSLGMVLLTKWWRLAAFGSMVLWACAAVIGIAVPGKCGCLGALEWRADGVKWIFIGLGGMCATWLAGTQRFPRQAGNTS